MWTNADLPDIGYGWAFRCALFMLMAVVPPVCSRTLCPGAIFAGPRFFYTQN